MSSPIQQGIPVGAFLPALFAENDNDELCRIHSNILYVDNYEKIYKKFGIKRYQMMVVVPFTLRTDPLAGVELYDYIGEETTENKE